jgi:uncharacterized FlaG/YvyC family protein
MANDQYDFSDFDETPVEATTQELDFSDFDDGKAATAPIDKNKAQATPSIVNNPVEDISQGESALRGGAQGISLGFADEIEAAARTPFQQKTSLTDLQSIADQYRQLRGEVRKEYKSAQEANPWTYGLSEAGASMAIPGGGAKILGKGALALGGQVLGSSEADLTKGTEDLGQLGTEGAVAGSLGVAAESAFPLAGKALKGANRAMGNPLEDLFKAYQQSSAGKKIFGDEARRAAEKQTQQVSEDLSGTLFSKGQKMGQQQSEILKRASDTKVDLMPEVNKFSDQLNALRNTESIDPRFATDDAKMQEIIQQIAAKKGLTDLPPTEVNALVKKLKDMSGISDTSLLKSPEAERALQGFERGVREQNYNAVPGLRDQNKSISDYNSLLEGLGLDKIRDAQYDPAIKTQIGNKVQNMVRGIERETEQGVRARQSFEKLKPELSQDQIVRTQDASDYYDITKKAGGQSLFDKSEIAAGAVIGKADRLLSAPTRAIEGLAESARNNGMNGLADGLAKVAAEKNDRARKALMFSLQQNPAYREFLNSMNPPQEGDNEY